MSATDSFYIREFSSWLKSEAKRSGIDGIRISVSNSWELPVFVMVIRDGRFFESVANTIDEAVSDLRSALENHELSKTKEKQSA